VSFFGRHIGRFLPFWDDLIACARPPAVLDARAQGTNPPMGDRAALEGLHASPLHPLT
jgi:hypothetical protein